MASFTLTRPDRFPSGTTVAVYPEAAKVSGAAPSGNYSQVTTGTAGSSSVTFTGLADETRYVAYASVGGDYRYVGFETEPPPSESSTVLQVTGGPGDRALIDAAIAGLRAASGKLDGILEIRGVARLTSTLTVDGGYSDTTPADANWATQTQERFRLIGSFAPDAGVGVAIDAHGFYGADWDVRLVGGGRYAQSTDAAMSSTVNPNVVNSPASVTAGITVGNVVQVSGAGDTAGSAAQPIRGRVTAINAGTGNITLDTTATTTVSGATIVFWDAGLLIRDQVAPRLNVYGKNFAGCGLVMDATSSTTNRVRSVRAGVLHFNSCGTGLHIKNVEGFGNLGDIWSDNKYGDYIRADDFAFDKYEGGIGGAGGTNIADVYLWLDRPNNWNGGKIAVGDRATEAGVKIIGISAGVAGSDLGHIDEIRSTGYQTASMPAAVKLCDVFSGDIGYVLTQNTAKGVHVQGGASSGNQVTVHRHESRTNDDVALYVEAGVNTAPQIAVLDALYRRNNKQAVYVASGLTGGRVKIGGIIVNHNLGNDSSSYAIDVQSSGVLLDVGGLWQQYRSGSTPGGINHVTAANVIGVRRARIENPSAVGNAPAKWQDTTVASAPPGTANGFRSDHAAIALGTAFQNDSPFTLKLHCLMRFQPSSGTTTAQLDVLFPAPTSSGLTQQTSQYEKYNSAAGSPNDQMRWIYYEIPPWHWGKLNNGGAVSINRILWTIE